jgi:hypothetical protein
MCLIGILMPFLHIFATYSPLNKTKILGYSTLGSFFYNIGWPTMVLCFGLLVRHLKRYAIEEAAIVFKTISIIGMALGVYFFTYAITPFPDNKDLPHWLYYSLLGLCAVLIASLVYRLPDANAKLKAIIRFWMSYLINDIPKKLPEDVKAAYYEELNRKMEESL